MIEKAIPPGLLGEKISRTITGTKKVCASRSTIATGAGAALGYATASGTVIGLQAAGLGAVATVAAPAVVPLAVLAGVVAFARSLIEQGNRAMFPRFRRVPDSDSHH